jgi:hypothetical protein
MDSEEFCEETGGHSSINIVPISERALEDLKEFVEGIGKDLFINVSGPVLKVVRSNEYYGPKFILVDPKDLKLDDETKEIQKEK